MAVGYVYLMTNGKDYKIGLTSSTPEDRMKQLQTGSSEQISLVAYTICMDMNSLENNLHTQFASKRKEGEWFALCEDNLHHVYSVFKQKSINIDMSLIPEAVSKDIDELMRIDGKRLARGDNTLYDKKYAHILDYKNIVLNYMHEEVKDIERKCKEEQEASINKWKERERLEELIREDAKRIFDGEKPLHTFEYKGLKDWKDELDDVINELRWKEEEKKEKEEQKAEEAQNRYEANTAEYQAKQRERAAGTARTSHSWKKYLDESEKHLFQDEELDLSVPEIKQKDKRATEEEEQKAQRAKKIEELKAQRAKEKRERAQRAKEEKDKKAEEAQNRYEANTAEYQAKQRERAAGTARTSHSWKKYLTEYEKFLFDLDE